MICKVNAYLELLCPLKELIPLPTQYHGFRESGRRHKIPGSETKPFITHSRENSKSFIIISISSKCKVKVIPGGYSTHSELLHIRGILKLGNLTVIKRTAR